MSPGDHRHCPVKTASANSGAVEAAEQGGLGQGRRERQRPGPGGVIGLRGFVTVVGSTIRSPPGRGTSVSCPPVIAKVCDRISRSPRVAVPTDRSMLPRTRGSGATGPNDAQVVVSAQEHRQRSVRSGDRPGRSLRLGAPDAHRHVVVVCPVRRSRSSRSDSIRRPRWATRAGTGLVGEAARNSLSRRTHASSRSARRVGRGIWISLALCGCDLGAPQAFTDATRSGRGRHPQLERAVEVHRDHKGLGGVLQPQASQRWEQ